MSSTTFRKILLLSFFVIFGIFTVPVSAKESKPVSNPPKKVLPCVHTIVNEKGKPIPNVHCLYQNPLKGDVYTRSDAKGKISFDLDPNVKAQHLWLIAPGYESFHSAWVNGNLPANDNELFPPEPLETKIVLSPGKTISGSVRDRETGKPIPDFAVTTGYTRGSKTELFPWVTADIWKRDGHFLLTNFIETHYTGFGFGNLEFKWPKKISEYGKLYYLYITAPGYEAAESCLFVPNKSNTTIDILLDKTKEKPVCGQVVDESSKPVAGLMVYPVQNYFSPTVFFESLDDHGLHSVVLFGLYDVTDFAREVQISERPEMEKKCCNWHETSTGHCDSYWFATDLPVPVRISNRYSPAYEAKTDVKGNFRLFPPEPMKKDSQYCRALRDFIGEKERPLKGYLFISQEYFRFLTVTEFQQLQSEGKPVVVEKNGSLKIKVQKPHQMKGEFFINYYMTDEKLGFIRPQYDTINGISGEKNEFSLSAAPAGKWKIQVNEEIKKSRFDIYSTNIKTVKTVIVNIQPGEKKTVNITLEKADCSK